MKLNFEKKMQLRLTLVLAVILFCLLGFIVFLLNYTTKETLREVTFQYVHNQKYELSSSTKMRLLSDGSYRLIIDSREIVPDNSPLYTKEKPSFLLLYDYIAVNPYTAVQSYVDSKSTFVLEKGIVNRYRDEVLIESALEGVLFDGKDTYITLETTVLKYMGKQIELSPFSFIEVVANESLRVYNYRSDQMEMIEITTKTQDVILTNKKEQYQLDLYFDALIAAQGQEILLFTSPLNLKGQK